MKKTVFTLSLLSGFTVFAQQNPTDSTESKLIDPVSIIGEKSKSLGGSGQYISFRQLQKINQTDVNNVIRLIPGVNVRDEEGFGLRPNIGLRGTAVNRSAKITLMEDGILIAPAPYADPSAYYFPTFARMHGVEVLKGSSQIKNGPFTIGGAINLISTPIPEDFKGFAQVSYGSFNTNQQRIWIGDQRKNFDYVFEVNRLASDGFKDLDNGGNTGFDRRDIMGKFRWKTDQNAAVPQSVMLKFVNMTEDSNETYLGLTYEDFQKNPLRRYSATQKDILDMNHQNISLNHQIAPTKNLKISTTAYFARTYRDWARANTVGGQSLMNIISNPTSYSNAYQIMTGNADGEVVYQSAARTYHSKGVQTNFQYDFRTGNVNHKLQLGARYHTDEADRFATRSTYNMNQGNMILTSVGVKGNQENQIRDAKSFASYISYDLHYKGLTVSPGVRYESIILDFQNFGNTDTGRLGTALKTANNDLSVFLPGIGFNYMINNSMNIFGGVHKGFSPPGMPSVKSTTGQAGIEKSINYEFGHHYNNNGLQTQITGFLNDYSNILGADTMAGGGAGTGDMFNAGKAKIYGVEASISYDILHKSEASNEVKIPLTIAYTYTSAKFRETFTNGGGDWGSGVIYKNDLIPFVTPHLLTASAGIETSKFNATIIGRYTGETRIKPGQNEIVTPQENIAYNDVNGLKSFVIVDFSANYKINSIFSVFSTVNNIFNSKAIVANLPQGYRPNMPFGVNFGIKTNF
ncbi:MULTISPECIES: TonB-dependent receptor family protein [Chryseobacterium]|uniref:Iron(III) dicitrate transport protein FecA n=1 Tax=Chryseobacterium taihuense TaxID=1141221 RepID=A0A4U8W875_9FLAO|nr:MULTISPECIES: TonB-dependent receptor [Chryseobacterium]QQV04202.1 TonB-dependent receptor [Chryseobacterium sp. FDAARGOS 1104]VFB02431.1 Iron(III) dicitrate transport protein FecA [Chryseobacterium taihuense]